MAKLMGMNFSLQGHLREDKDTNCFVTYCPALDLYSAGKTRPEAKDALRNTVALFISICYDRGIFDKVLRDQGFGVAEAGVAPPHTGTQECIAIHEAATTGEDYDDVFDVDVPLHLVAAAVAIGEACHQ